MDNYYHGNINVFLENIASVKICKDSKSNIFAENDRKEKIFCLDRDELWVIMNNLIEKISEIEGKK